LRGTRPAYRFAQRLRYDSFSLNEDLSMWLVSLILLVLLGLLGIASWLKSRQPNLNQQIGQLESIEGWVGIVGLIWGIVLLLRWLSALGLFGYAPGMMIISLLTALVVIALSLILALPQLKTLFGSNDFTGKMGDLASRLGPYKVGLGFACLVLALYSLLAMARVL
jgi:uncharacterized protein YacL